jgi:multidrug efflux system membrane fusion protein
MMTSLKLAAAAAAIALAGFFGWRHFDVTNAQAVETPATGSPASAQSGRGKGGAGAAGAATISVNTEIAEKTDFPVRKRSIGWVESPATVTIRARIDSQIATQRVQDGQMVKAGDLLFELDDRAQQAQLLKDQSALLRDQALYQRIERDLARAQNLLSKGAATQQQVDQSTSDEKSTAASIKSDEAAIQVSKLQLSYTKIYAPIDGRVGAIQVTPGNLVSANGATGLVTITQVSPVRVTFTMPEHELPAIRSAMAAATPPEVSVFPNGSATATARGALNFIDSTVDIMSGTVTLKAALANTDLALWPGQYVNVELHYAPLHDMTVVPTVAVQTGQDSPFIYVVKPGNTVELRKVAVAATEGNRTALRDGLAPGERVVTDGQVGLTSGARVRDAGVRQAEAENKPVSTD